MSKKNTKKKTLSLFHVFLVVICVFILKLLLPYYFKIAFRSSFLVVSETTELEALFFPIILLFFIVKIYFSNNSKKISYAVLSFLLCLNILLVTNVSLWTFDKNNIFYRKIFGIESQQYTYSDVEKAYVYLGAPSRRSYSKSIVFDVKMNDGNEIQIELSQVYFDDYDDIVLFDKLISSKRYSIYNGENKQDILSTDNRMTEKVADYFYNIITQGKNN